MTEPAAKKATPVRKMSPMVEIGVTGLRQSYGYLADEYLRDLAGGKARTVYRDMSSNDPTVAAALSVLSLMIRSAGMAIDPARPDDGRDQQAEEIAEFFRQAFDDMSHSFDDFLAECLTMNIYGWSYFEIVYKKRDGADQMDPRRRSKYDDGLYGWRKIAPRGQLTLERWEMQADGGINGMQQRDPNTGGSKFLPIMKSILFRTVSRNNSPEGVSLLRGCYRPWLFLQRIQETEAIGIERELAGLPVMYVPSEIANSTDPESVAAMNAYKKAVRDIRFNQQAGMVLVSDPWPNPDGTLSNAMRVKFELVKGVGQRSIDTVSVKRDYKTDILRCFLADFLMLGQAGAGGSYNLGENRNDLFVQSLYAITNAVYGPINRFLIPRLAKMNGFPLDLLPTVRPDRIAPLNIATLGQFVRDMSLAGAAMFPDDDLENQLRNEADLPPKPADMQQPEPNAEDKAIADAALAAAAKDKAAKDAAAAGGGEGQQGPA